MLLLLLFSALFVFAAPPSLNEQLDYVRSILWPALTGNGTTSSSNCTSGASPLLACSAEAVTIIDAQNRGLQGTLPDSLQNVLVGLNHLRLGLNLLFGTIPMLPATLVHLELSDNRLSGTLPAVFPTNLNWLSLAGNRLHGSTSMLHIRAEGGTNLCILVAKNDPQEESCWSCPLAPNASACVNSGAPPFAPCQGGYNETCTIATAWPSPAPTTQAPTPSPTPAPTYSLAQQLAYVQNEFWPSLAGTNSTSECGGGTDPFIACSGAALTKIIGSQLNLTGTLRSDLAARLPHLTVLRLRTSGIRGSIPSVLPSQLTRLELNWNRLNGTIPPLPSTLISLAVQGNLLSGALPAIPSSLQTLAVQMNQLEGPLYFSLDANASFCQLAFGSVYERNCFDCDMPSFPAHCVDITDPCESLWRVFWGCEDAPTKSPSALPSRSPTRAPTPTPTPATTTTATEATKTSKPAAGAIETTSGGDLSALLVAAVAGVVVCACVVVALAAFFCTLRCRRRRPAHRHRRHSRATAANSPSTSPPPTPRANPAAAAAAAHRGRSVRASARGSRRQSTAHSRPPSKIHAPFGSKLSATTAASSSSGGGGGGNSQYGLIGLNPLMTLDGGGGGGGYNRYDVVGGDASSYESPSALFTQCGQLS